MNLRVTLLAGTIGTVIAAQGVMALKTMARYTDRRTSSRHSDGPITDCNDVRMQFDGRDAVVQSEEHTLTKAEATPLRVSAVPNGGIQLQGWDKDTYSVTVCKYAAPYNDAQNVLSQIKGSVRGGEVSASGPSKHDDWSVYFLVRTPKAASVDVHADNGPIALYSVDGSVKAHTTNGPVSVKDSTGDADVSAVNGPISYEGSGGKLRLHTQNGPISVYVSGTTWNGESLVADAVNGPVTLHVPDGFQSSFVVESKGYSPVSCKSSICDQARKTWDDDHKRIEYGSSPAVIQVSTVNGPVSVH